MTNSAGPKRSDADLHDEAALVEILLRHRVLAAANEVGGLGRRPGERALLEHVLQEGRDLSSDQGPCRFVVRLEHRPLQPAMQALLDEQGRPADRDVPPISGFPAHGPGAPHPDPMAVLSDGVDALPS
jgi:hypothetical protein